MKLKTYGKNVKENLDLTRLRFRNPRVVSQYENTADAYEKGFWVYWGMTSKTRSQTLRTSRVLIDEPIKRNQRYAIWNKLCAKNK